MKLGLIGNPLGHSWSPEIHAFFLKQKYALWPLEEDQLDDFFAKKDFDGINVTIPYKQKVIPFLDELDETAESVGAVNCIVNRNGKLKGYNTDCIGLRDMISAHHIDVKDKKAAVLGSGGASKAAMYALRSLGADPHIISRSPSDTKISYEELYETESSYQILVNTTPVGMTPRSDEEPVDLERFTNLTAVIDIIANPLRTKLQFHAERNGLQYAGGFEMLVRQALAADEYFCDAQMDKEQVKPCMDELLKEKRNIVFIGMPTSGKTTVSEELSKITGRNKVEMDDEIVERLGTSIAQCFQEKGEAYFRNLEKETAEAHRLAKGEIISCGGGVIKTPETMRYLSENGLIIWIRRDLSHLYPTDSRPLSSDEEAVKKLYEERLPLYQTYSDITVDNNATIEETITEIRNKTGI